MASRGWSVLRGAPFDARLDAHLDARFDAWALAREPKLEWVCFTARAGVPWCACVCVCGEQSQKQGNANCRTPFFAGGCVREQAAHEAAGLLEAWVALVHDKSPGTVARINASSDTALPAEVLDVLRQHYASLDGTVPTKRR